MDEFICMQKFIWFNKFSILACNITYLSIHFGYYAAEFGHSISRAVEDDIFYLKFIFMVGVMLCQVSKLLSQMKTVL